MFWFEDNGLTEEALGMIVSEDLHQRDMWGNQRHSIYKWLVIINEEMGEISKAALEGKLESIESEATQVATLALKIAWMARLKRKG